MAEASMVHDTETRDLMALVAKRQSEAVQSVAQLARDPAQAFAVYQTAATVALGAACGAYGAWKGRKVQDPIEFAEVILQMMKEAR
jgi:hypothetical protein